MKFHIVQRELKKFHKILCGLNHDGYRVRVILILNFIVPYKVGKFLASFSKRTKLNGLAVISYINI
jgi:hypothetical protein